MDGLIRLQRWQLDEKRRSLADLENMRADFADRLRLLEEEMAREKDFASSAPEKIYLFNEYVTAALARKHAIEISVSDIDREIEAARKEVEWAFQELKKTETVEARRQQERKTAMARREQADLDEIALEQYRRRSSQG